MLRIAGVYEPAAPLDDAMERAWIEVNPTVEETS